MLGGERARAGERPGRGPYVMYASRGTVECHQALMALSLLAPPRVRLRLLEPVPREGAWHVDRAHQPRGFSLLARGPRRVDRAPLLWSASEGGAVATGAAAVADALARLAGPKGGHALIVRERRVGELVALVNERLATALVAGGSGDADEAASARRAVAIYLAMFETQLQGRRYLAGERLSLADLALVSVGVRLEAAEDNLWGTCLDGLERFPSLLAHARRVAAEPRLAWTFDGEAILCHYFEGYGVRPPARTIADPARLKALLAAR